MKAILYMLVHSLKNAVIDVLRHPARGIVYLFLIVSVAYGAVSGFTMSAEIDTIGDMRILSGAYLAILYFVSIPVMLKGLSMGARFFSQSDVSNIFVAPISEKKILIYGIGRQLTTVLFLVFCFLSYGSIAMRYFNISVSSAVFLIVGLLCMLVFVQLMTILIFCICNGHRIRSAIVKSLIYFLPVYALGAALIHLFTNGFTYENFLQAISLPIFEYVPIIGWIHALIFGIMQNSTATVILYGSLLLVMAVLAVVVLCVSKLDYYEDVLQKTENYFEAVNAYREGKVTDSMMMGNKKVKLRKMGLNHGWGATAFFFKHNREGFRRSRFPLFNINTVVLLCVSLLIAFGMKTAIADIVPTLIVLSVVVITSYIQFFFSTAGDWVKELNKPYIYLVPDSGVKKLIMASMTTLIKPLTDATVAFGILGIVISANIFDIITAVLVYASFGSVYLVSNIMTQRIVGLNGSRGIFITFYMGFILVMLVPGIAGGILALTQLSGTYSELSATIMGIPVFAWNTFISLIIFLLCKNLLNNTE